MEDIKNVDNWTTRRETSDNHKKSSVKIKDFKKCELCSKEFATKQRKETHESECKKIPKKTFEKDQEDIKIMSDEFPKKEKTKIIKQDNEPTEIKNMEINIKNKVDNISEKDKAEIKIKIEKSVKTKKKSYQNKE